MAKNKNLDDSSIQYIIELSKAELRLLIQLMHLYQASKKDSVLAKAFFENIKTQTDITIDPLMNNVFSDILDKSIGMTRKGLTRLNSVPFIPYET